MKRRIITIAAVPLLFLGAAVVMWAQQDQQEQAKPVPQQTKPSKPESKPSEGKTESGGEARTGPQQEEKRQPGEQNRARQEQQRQIENQQTHAQREQQKQTGEQQKHVEQSNKDRPRNNAGAPRTKITIERTIDGRREPKERDLTVLSAGRVFQMIDFASTLATNTDFV